MWDYRCEITFTHIMLMLSANCVKRAENNVLLLVLRTLEQLIETKNVNSERN